MANILKANVWRQPILANTDILPAPLSTSAEVAIFRVTVALAAAARLAVVFSGQAVSEVIQLNSGVNLAADCLYAFDVPVTTGIPFNLRCSAVNQVVLLIVQELEVR